jgi:hypothetical protein
MQRADIAETEQDFWVRPNKIVIQQGQTGIGGHASMCGDDRADIRIGEHGIDIPGSFFWGASGQAPFL